VAYNTNLFEKKTGLKLDKKTQIDILKKLHFDVVEKGDNLIVTPHPQRTDIVIPENIVAELVRIYGYEKIGLTDLPQTSISAVHNEMNLELKQKLANRGLNEAPSFGFGNSKIEKMLTDKPIIPIANPIIVDLDTARNNLLGNLLIAVANNEKRGFANLNMFEIGTVFDGQNPGEQHTSLCIVRTGETSPKHWQKRNRKVDVFDVKADLISLLGAQKYTIDTTNAPLWAHPYVYGKIVQGKKVLGEFGELHPSIAKQLHIKTKVFVALVENIEDLPKNPKYKKTPITDFMPITRDFAFVVDSKYESQKIVATALASDSCIANVVIFDSFDIGNDQKSIAFTITIYPDHNMSDKELTEIQEKVIKNIENKCGAKLRA
jgi:phenylalanyl-tRNA synthetase beta chain